MVASRPSASLSITPIATASAIGMYKFSDSFSLGAGMGYDGQTGSLSPLPLVSLNLRLGERWRARGVVPTRLEIEFHPRKWFTAGILGTLNGNRYHLDAAKYGGSDPELAYSVYAVGPKLTVSLGSLVHLDLYNAVAVLRRFGLFENGSAVGSDSLKPSAMWGDSNLAGNGGLGSSRPDRYTKTGHRGSRWVKAERPNSAVNSARSRTATTCHFA